jgi:hypothetical protein
MYSVKNYKSKKALREAVAIAPVPAYQPGPFGAELSDGQHACEGPHYPQAHKWYASVTVENGCIVKVHK